MHRMPLAFSLALAKAGNNIPARMAMIAMTTNNSMSVKPPLRLGRPGRVSVVIFFMVSTLE
jgi:hypothetical protein